MDSFQFWLYVIIGVIYFISRMRKKKAEQSGGPAEVERERSSERSRPPVTSTQPKPLSFEDLLREITQSKEQQRPKEEPVVDYDDDLGEEEKDLEEVEYDYRKDNKTYEAYEEAKKQAFFRPSLEETLRVEDTVVTFGKFKEFESGKETNLAAEYLKEFHDPEGLKKAVVMSEILKRKF